MFLNCRLALIDESIDYIFCMEISNYYAIVNISKYLSQYDAIFS